MRSHATVPVLSCSHLPLAHRKQSLTMPFLQWLKWNLNVWWIHRHKKSKHDGSATLHSVANSWRNFLSHFFSRLTLENTLFFICSSDKNKFSCCAKKFGHSTINYLGLFDLKFGQIRLLHYYIMWPNFRLDGNADLLQSIVNITLPTTPIWGAESARDKTRLCANKNRTVTRCWSFKADLSSVGRYVQCWDTVG